jgi:hypothetical protein
MHAAKSGLPPAWPCRDPAHEPATFTLLALSTPSLFLHSAPTKMVLSFILIQNRQYVENEKGREGLGLTEDRGKTRLAKWYAPYSVSCASTWIRGWDGTG